MAGNGFSSTSPALVLDLTKSAGKKSESNGSHPSSHYLYAPDPNSPSTWKFLVKMAGGGIDKRRLGAAWSVLHDGSTDCKLDALTKSTLKGKLKALYKEAGIPVPTETKVVDLKKSVYDVGQTPMQFAAMTDDASMKMDSDHMARKRKLQLLHKTYVQQMENTHQKHLSDLHQEHMDNMKKALQGGYTSPTVLQASLSPGGDSALNPLTLSKSENGQYILTKAKSGQGECGETSPAVLYGLTKAKSGQGETGPTSEYVLKGGGDGSGGVGSGNQVPTAQAASGDGGQKTSPIVLATGTTGVGPGDQVATATGSASDGGMHTSAYVLQKVAEDQHTSTYVLCKDDQGVGKDASTGQINMALSADLADKLSAAHTEHVRNQDGAHRDHLRMVESNHMAKMANLDRLHLMCKNAMCGYN